MTQAIDTDLAQGTAARWYARMNGAPTEADRHAFAAWLAASEGHRRAWDHVRMVEALLGQAGPLPETRRMVTQALAAPDVPARHTARWAGLSIAATMAVMVAGGALLLHHRGAPVRQVAYTAYDNGPGAPRDITLGDGSVVTLDGRSHIQVALGDKAAGAERRVTLTGGRAFFRVAHDAAHPFVVSAMGSTITALGTQFDVRAETGRMVTTLIQGRIRVDMPAQGRTATLTPGMQIALYTGAGAADSVVESHLSAARATEWMAGRATYDDTPLGEVVADLNRHAARCLTLADPHLAGRRISGVFRTDKGAAMADALVAYGIARRDGTDAAGCIRLKAS